MPAIIGTRLRAEREARGWSREAMARRLGAASSEALPAIDSLAHMIKEWEAGKHGVSRRYRMLYAAAFGVDEENLFGDEGDAPLPSPQSPRHEAGVLGLFGAASLTLNGRPCRRRLRRVDPPDQSGAGKAGHAAWR